MKSTMTLTDDVTVGTMEDLRSVSDALADLVTKAENFAIDGEVERVQVELKTDPESYRCARRGVHSHDSVCEAQKQPGRTYAQLVVKVSSND